MKVLVVAAKCGDCGEEMVHMHDRDGTVCYFPFEFDALSLRQVPNECGYCGGQVLVSTEPIKRVETQVMRR